MKEAKISDIFISLQGEGVYLGVPQLFIRFYGCNLSCAFCDTKLLSYRTFTRDSLMSKILEYRQAYHSISLTGGEPLLQAGFIRDFMEEYRKFYRKKNYLETNGTLSKELRKVIAHIDIVAMDFKLPSSTKGPSLWKEHENFLKISSEKETFVKAVSTSETTAEDITRMLNIVKKAGKNIPVILQPVTTVKESEKVNEENLSRFASILKGGIRDVEVIPQMHTVMGIK